MIQRRWSSSVLIFGLISQRYLQCLPLTSSWAPLSLEQVIGHCVGFELCRQVSSLSIPPNREALEFETFRNRGLVKIARPPYILPLIPRQFFHLGFSRAWGHQFSMHFPSVCVCVCVCIFPNAVGTLCTNIAAVFGVKSGQSCKQGHVACFMRAQRSNTATTMVKNAHHMQVQKYLV